MEPKQAKRQHGGKRAGAGRKPRQPSGEVVAAAEAASIELARADDSSRATALVPLAYATLKDVMTAKGGSSTAKVSAAKFILALAWSIGEVGTREQQTEAEKQEASTGRFRPVPPPQLLIGKKG